MAGHGTEKPTPRRLLKAREEGRFPSARALVAGLEFAGFVALLSWVGGPWFHDFQRMSIGLLQRAASTRDLSSGELVYLLREVSWRTFLPLILGGAGLLVLMLLVQLLVTGFGLHVKGLAPNLERLNPGPRLKSIWQQNLLGAGQALVMLPVFLYVVYRLSKDNMEAYFALPLTGVVAAFSHVAQSFDSLLWKAAGFFLAFGVFDLLRERRRYMDALKMTRHEIQEELKETEGSPQIKGRIRRLQRDAARRRMMSQVPLATAVVVNPTHYAVALRYDMEAHGAPLVVAKGKNYLARRIRQIATEHEIPIVENPPLAQALYRAAAVGQEIPLPFYKAVAEILAYVYKLMHGRGSRTPA